MPERYLITSVPTLMAFSRRGEAQLGTRVEDVRELGDGTFLRLWIEEQAGREGGGGGGVEGGGGRDWGVGCCIYRIRTLSMHDIEVSFYL